jgi:hypothetical protein
VGWWEIICCSLVVKRAVGEDVLSGRWTSTELALSDVPHLYTVLSYGIYTFCVHCVCVRVHSSTQCVSTRRTYEKDKRRIGSCAMRKYNNDDNNRVAAQQSRESRLYMMHGYQRSHTLRILTTPSTLTLSLSSFELHFILLCLLVHHHTAQIIVPSTCPANFLVYDCVRVIFRLWSY